MSVFLLEGAVTHAARGCDGRQEGRECGYYHLHRHLNDALLHASPPFRLILVEAVVTIVVAVVTTAGVDDESRGLTRHCEATRVDTTVLSQFDT